MKRVLALILFSIILQQANAQDAKWDSTFRPGNYKANRDMFAAYPMSRKDIVFLGNSITAGVNWFELLGNKHAKNRGISGDITFGVLERLDEIIAAQPKKVFILIGINDISRNIPDSYILANYKKIIERIQAGSPRTKIYWQTLLPVNNTFTQFKNHYNKDEHIQYLNDEIRKFPATYGITVVDLHPHFLDANKKLRADITVDGLHLTAEGYKIWRQVLRDGHYL